MSRLETSILSSALMGSNDTLCNDKAQPERYQTCPKEPVYFLLLGPAVALITY